MSTIIYGSSRKSKETHLFTKDNPFLAQIKYRLLLNKAGSCKKTFHLALDITGSAITYHEGDAVGIWPQNDPALVAALLSLLRVPKETLIRDPHVLTTLSLEEYLYHKPNLSRVTPALLQLLLTSSIPADKRAILTHLLQPENKTMRAQYIKEHDVLTCLKDMLPQTIDVFGFVASLAPMLPRFYSITSSQDLYPHEIHLLVATFSYSLHNEKRSGLASHFLCHSNHNFVPLYVLHNPHFALPTDPRTPVIMIGPGTGVAPYRAFLQKRASLSVKTRNWLFFGECNRAYDFYYEEEFLDYVRRDVLRLSTAFSRDQEHKFYVQHAMEQQSRDIWTWIEEGAHLYVCGDATRMAKDVTQTLLSIFQKEGRFSAEEAKAFLHKLRKEKRYQTDVY